MKRFEWMLPWQWLPSRWPCRPGTGRTGGGTGQEAVESGCFPDQRAVAVQRRFVRWGERRRLGQQAGHPAVVPFSLNEDGT